MNFILSLILTLLSISGYCQKNPDRDEIYDACIRHDIRLIEYQQSIITKQFLESKSETTLLKLVNAEYELISFYLKSKQKEKAAFWLEKGEKHLEELFEYNNNSAEYWAVKGAFIGFSIGINPLKAPFLGSKSSECLDKALMLEPNSPRAWLEKANSLFYAPEAFGGNKKQAIKDYELAISLFEKDEHNIENWIYLSSLISLAKAYEKIKEYDNAKTIYLKAMKIEPDFQYVRESLLLELYKKMQK